MIHLIIQTSKHSRSPKVVGVGNVFHVIWILDYSEVSFDIKLRSP